MAWFKNEFGILKKGPKGPHRMPQEKLFNLNGEALVKTIHDRHQQKISKMGKNEVDLTHNTNGDSASHPSSSLQGDNESSSNGSRSSTSSEAKEMTGSTSSG
jgi:hypothetical protein